MGTSSDFKIISINVTLLIIFNANKRELWLLSRMVGVPANTTPIIVAALTVLAGAIPLISTAFNNFVLEQPSINVDIVPKFENNPRKAVINVTNPGPSSITNISLFVQSSDRR
jgi:hypothetical protein